MVVSDIGHMSRNSTDICVLSLNQMGRLFIMHFPIVALALKETRA